MGRNDKKLKQNGRKRSCELSAKGCPCYRNPPTGGIANLSVHQEAQPAERILYGVISVNCAALCSWLARCSWEHRHPGPATAACLDRGMVINLWMGRRRPRSGGSCVSSRRPI